MAAQNKARAADAGAKTAARYGQAASAIAAALAVRASYKPGSEERRMRTARMACAVKAKPATARVLRERDGRRR